MCGYMLSIFDEFFVKKKEKKMRRIEIFTESFLSKTF